MSIAFNFTCSERQVDICIRMTALSQLETIRNEIDDLKAEILNTKEALANAQDAADVDFLRKQLERLHKEKIIL